MRFFLLLSVNSDNTKKLSDVIEKWHVSMTATNKIVKYKQQRGICLIAIFKVFATIETE